MATEAWVILKRSAQGLEKKHIDFHNLYFLTSIVRVTKLNMEE